MPAKPFILFAPDATDVSWRAGTSGPTFAEGVDARAALDALGYKGQPVVLAVPSRWCLGAMISTADLPRKDRRRAMLYRLEEKLPLAAEEVVADFIAGLEGSADAFGVCVATATLGPVIDALEADGIPVRHACPAALLAAREAVEAAPAGAAIVWQSPAGVELIFTAAGRPSRWLSLPIDPAAVALHLRLATAERPDPTVPLPLRTEAASPELLTSVAAVEGVSVESEGDRPLAEAATDAGAAILNGRPAWVDFRRDALAAPDSYDRLRPPLTAALLAAGLALATLSGVTLWRARANDHFADKYEAAERAVFSEVFPKAPVPPATAVRRRLQIEQGRVSGSAGPGTGAGPSALVLLNDALDRLPADVRYRLVELRVSPSELFLDGQARTHGDAGALADGLRKMGYFEIAPPGTEQVAMDKGEGPAVAFRINGTHEVKKPAARGGP